MVYSNRFGLHFSHSTCGKGPNGSAARLWRLATSRQGTEGTDVDTSGLLACLKG